jgi:hypothetical protein
VVIRKDAQQNSIENEAIKDNTEDYEQGNPVAGKVSY